MLSYKLTFQGHWELLCKHLRTKKALAHKASPPLGLHISHRSQILHEDYVIWWKSFTGWFSNLNTELLLILSSKHYSLQQKVRRQIVVPGLKFCSISHMIKIFTELRKVLNGPLHPIYSILYQAIPNVKSLWKLTLSFSFYWTPSSSTFHTSLTKEGFTNVKHFGKCFFLEPKHQNVMFVWNYGTSHRGWCVRQTGMNAPFATQEKEPELHMCYQQTRTTTTDSRPRQKTDFSEGIKWVQMSVTQWVVRN